ncbi:hypothetical protein BT96DRAFT_929239 [Gymnopus androsaceus JB14]|uniref:Uncharacterized protein n=1 Tax=Gymnopus androsaceus JB14 TaxID=1447944 RepID=A0A6A4GG13_9AGAR|nr:hypothetical protein BT96DRAFT_929239 [Gymnopus androsaceus JB14]
MPPPDAFPYQKCDIAAKKSCNNWVSPVRELIEQEYNISCCVFNNFEGLVVG